MRYCRRKVSELIRIISELKEAVNAEVRIRGNGTSLGGWDDVLAFYSFLKCEFYTLYKLSVGPVDQSLREILQYEA